MKPVYKRKSNPGFHYVGTGFGRDSYINYNNGGFSMTNSPSQQMRSGNMPRHGQRMGYIIPPARFIKGKSVHYRQDGTGRDGYILHNNGGFGGSSLSTNAPFDRNLRKYEKVQSLTSLPSRSISP